MGNRNISISASGQQSTNKIHQRRITSSVLIESLFALLHKHLTNQQFAQFLEILAASDLQICKNVQRMLKSVQW